MIAMSHHMQLKVVAKGVETEQQAGFLRRCRCDCAQGYLFGAPMQPASVLELLQQAAGAPLIGRPAVSAPVPLFPLVSAL